MNWITGNPHKDIKIGWLSPSMQQRVKNKRYILNTTLFMLEDNEIDWLVLVGEDRYRCLTAFEWEMIAEYCPGALR